MKKSNFWVGFVFLLAGIAFLLASLLLDSALDSLFCGFSGAFIVSGVAQMYKYCKWTSPKHAAEYRERLEQERIDLEDERKSMLRDKSGRYAYILGLIVAAVGMLAVAVLSLLDVLSAPASRLLMAVLVAYTIFQYLAGLVIYRFLSRKY